MNSLSFLSKQLDASVPRSASQSRLYAAAGSDSEPSSSTARSTPNLNGNYKRSRTWSKPLFFRQRPKKPIFHLDGDSEESDDDIQHQQGTTQRSFSSPAALNKGSPTYPAPRLKPPVVEVVESSQLVVNESYLSRRFRRHQLIRAIATLWECFRIVCERIIIVPLVAPELNGKPTKGRRKGKAKDREAESDDTTTAEERDSDDEPLTVNPVTRAPPGELIKPPALQLISPSAISRYTILESPGPGPLFTMQAPPFPPLHGTTPTTTPPPPPSPPRRSLFDLPKILVLDLDETLIHSTSRPMHRANYSGGLFGFEFGGKRNPPGHAIEVVLNGRRTLYHVYKRPFVDYFLRKVSGWYTLVIFTASMQEYADPVIDWLDAGRGLLKRRLFRDSCTQLPGGSYTKDLSLIEGDLSRVCLVDNSPICYSVNPANGIPIEGWTDNIHDEALLDLLPVLDSLRFTSDVRRVLGLRGFI